MDRRPVGSSRTVALRRRLALLEAARRALGPLYEKSPDQKRAIEAIDRKLAAVRRLLRDPSSGTA